MLYRLRAALNESGLAVLSSKAVFVAFDAEAPEGFVIKREELAASVSEDEALFEARTGVMYISEMLDEWNGTGLSRVTRTSKSPTRCSTGGATRDRNAMPYRS